MKNLYKSSLLIAASAVALTASAQATFEFSFGGINLPNYKTTQNSAAIVADFTNNDLFDVYFGGYNYDGDWERFGAPGCWPWMQHSNLYINKGNGEWDFKGIKTEPVEGEFEEKEKDGVMVQVQKRRELPSDNGIDPSQRNAFAAFDYDNDGLVDLLVYGYLDSNDVAYTYRNDRYVQYHDTREEKVGTDSEWDNKWYSLFLYHNNGDGTFSKLDQFNIPPVVIDGNSDHGERFFNNIFAIGDFDRDGYVDIAINGKAPVRSDNQIYRRCELWRNNEGDGTFTKQLIAENKGGDAVAPDKTTKFPGEFIPTSGNVMFADLNNDGWLDLVFTGYCSENIDPEYADTQCVGRVYINQEGEKFVDVTAADFVPQRSAALAIADIDGDGYLDLYNPGYGNGWDFRLWYNNAAEKEFVFGGGEGSYELMHELGLPAEENYIPRVRDFNGDGRLDVLYDGRANNALYLQDEEGRYYNYTGLEGNGWNPVRGISDDNGKEVVVDFNGDGLADRFLSGDYWMEENMRQLRWDDATIEGADWARSNIFFLNTNDASAIVKPAAPTNVKCEIENGMLNITWTDCEDVDGCPANSLAYNIYIENENSGEIYSLIPANPVNGFLKVADGKHVCVRPGVQSYSIPAMYDEGYRVGVQAISLHNETYSPFAFDAHLSGIDSVVADNTTVKVVVNGDAVTVNADATVPVAIYNTLGQKIAAGMTNAPIAVAQQGVIIVNAAGKSVKVVK